MPDYSNTLRNLYTKLRRQKTAVCETTDAIIQFEKLQEMEATSKPPKTDTLDRSQSIYSAED